MRSGGSEPRRIALIPLSIHLIAIQSIWLADFRIFYKEGYWGAL